jgi:hypothetical protein
MGFETYLLMANPNAADATVQVTYLREDGTTVVKTYTVAALTRVVVYVNGMVPELVNESFAIAVRSTNGVPVVVERSMYWQNWRGGTSVTATPVP